MYTVALRYPETTFAFIIALLSLFYGAAMLLLMKKLREDPETVMARLKLNKASTTKDFKNMMLGNITIAAFMFVLLIATETEITALFHAAYAGMILGSGLVVAVMLKWVKNYAME